MTASAGALVRRFYDDVWNREDYGAAERILAEGFVFRASLGPQSAGVAPFIAYAEGVHLALGDYRCEILDLIEQHDAAAARMRFSGSHRATFLGFPPTGATIAWQGAAFFKIAADRIQSLWVLGDLDALKRDLAARRG